MSGFIFTYKYMMHYFMSNNISHQKQSYAYAFHMILSNIYIVLPADLK